MATSTDPLQREAISVVARDTGDRLQAPNDNSALRLARALGNIQPALSQTLGAISDQQQKDQEAKAHAAALEASGAPLADAVRQGTIKATQNPWFIQAYERESAAIRGTDALSKLQTESGSWEERNDPGAFAKRWHSEVANLTKQFDASPDAIKGFSVAEAQASQQVLATNQAYNSSRIVDERKQNISALAADSIIREVQARGGHVSGSQVALALAPAKQQWIATGGSLEDWNKLAISAVTTASYSVRSPSLLDALKDPALVNGPRPDDASRYGEGVDDHAPDLPAPLVPVQPQAEGPAVSTDHGRRLQPPAMGRITNTYAQHLARGSHGVDIAVPIGTHVQTPIAGTASVGHDAKSGLFVRIVGPNGKIVTSFAHLSLAQVQDGEKVTPGQVVARSGNSGDATGPHIHWRVKVDGKDVDPLSYQVTHQAPQAEAAGGNQAPELAPPSAVPPAPATIAASPGGPSLYDIAGVADQAESDRYRIQASVNSQASDKLQAITAQRKLDALAATDRLWETFGTKLLTGDIPESTIVGTLSKGGYSAQVIAGAVSNIRDAVGDSASLSTARLSIAGNDPGKAKPLFDLMVEGRTNGYSEAYEQRVANHVIAGDISAADGASMVGASVSRTDSIAAQGRAGAAFAAAHPAGAGEIIKKAGDLSKGVDQLAAGVVQRVQFVLGKQLDPGYAKRNRAILRDIILSHLANFPGDYAGAEKAARDYTADLVRKVMASKNSLTTTASPAAATGGNPRR